MRQSVIVFAFFAASVIIPRVAEADTVEWSAAAMTCTPSATTIAQNKYVTTAGVVKFKPNESGRIVFLCMVSSPLPDGTYFLAGQIEAASPNHTGLKMQLRRRHKVSGAISNIASAATVSIADQPLRRFASQFPTDINFEFDKFVYWIQITMDKESAASAVPPPLLNAELIRVN